MAGNVTSGERYRHTDANWRTVFPVPLERRRTSNRDLHCGLASLKYMVVMANRVSSKNLADKSLHLVNASAG